MYAPTTSRWPASVTAKFSGHPLCRCIAHIATLLTIDWAAVSSYPCQRHTPASSVREMFTGSSRSSGLSVRRSDLNRCSCLPGDRLANRTAAHGNDPTTKYAAAPNTPCESVDDKYLA